MAVLFFIGIVVALIGSIWLLIVAFEKSVWWGLGCLLVPLVSLIFILMHWKKAWKPFAVNVIGGTLIVLGFSAVVPDAQSLTVIFQTQKQITEQLSRGEISKDQAAAELKRMFEALIKGQAYEPNKHENQKPDFDTADNARSSQELAEKEKALLARQAAELKAKKEKLAREAEQRKLEFQKRYQSRQRKQVGYQKINIADAEDYLGEEIKITTTQGNTRIGTLLNINGDIFIIGNRTGTGEYSYNMKKNSISRIEIYTTLK